MAFKFKVIHEFGPEERIVAMIEFRDHIIVATERGLYKLEDETLKPLKWVEPTGGT